MLQIEEKYDIAIIGGGMAGICAAISSAREGKNTVLIHNRPVLGGNASSEIRMHICGADYHASRENARETGLLEEILSEHKHRNPENSYAIFDAVLWEKVAFQDNLILHLNTQMTDVEMEDGRIQRIHAIQLNTEKRFIIQASIFVDATGDGILAELSGADYTVGREGKNVYGEQYAPEGSDHCTMGNSLMFKARDMGHPVPYIAPFWANTYTEEDLKLRDHSQITSGYWWVELGGDKQHTIHDSEEIRDDLLKAVYGVWDHIKNGGNHDAENMELEWVGFLPGKRESRRILGDYVLREQDCLNAARFEDGVAYGGWPMDVHVIEGFQSKGQDATVFIKLPDVYSIPYRCLYSRNIENLMMAGRNISCSHMAFASTRVMGTCAVGGQAVGVAAAMAVDKGVAPREIGKDIKKLQQRLLQLDCYIPGVKNEQEEDIARTAAVEASSYEAGAEPANVINGVARTVSDKSNYWRPLEDDNAWIQLHFPCKKNVSYIQCIFDSNLSREITISISDAVLSRQEKGTPSELVREFEVTCISDNKIVHKQIVKDNYQRRCEIQFPQTIMCDSIKITIRKTHGVKKPKLFEIRVYKEK